MMMRNLFAGVVLASALGAQPALASVNISFGAGSAVSTIDAQADFESMDALFDNPYLEDGLSFTRTGLTFDNNTCGFASVNCPGHVGFAGFTGNFMYGVGSGGFFEVSTTGGDLFDGLEFQVGTGFSQSSADVVWEAFLGNISVGSGTAFGVGVGSVVGFSGAQFDRLRYSDANGRGAPAFDSVRADLTQGGGGVPEPATWALMIMGFGLAGATLRRRTAVAQSI